MNSYMQYDSQYPLYPSYIDGDSAAAMNPGIRTQHMSDQTGYGREATYQSAPPGRISTMSNGMPGNIQPSRVNTFVLEDAIFKMKNQINIIYYMLILIIIIVAVILFCNTILLISVGVKNKS
jgi:hypothetical protein